MKSPAASQSCLIVRERRVQLGGAAAEQEVLELIKTKIWAIGNVLVIGS
jgi:hypothetical protein